MYRLFAGLFLHCPHEIRNQKYRAVMQTVPQSMDWLFLLQQYALLFAIRDKYATSRGLPLHPVRILLQNFQFVLSGTFSKENKAKGIKEFFSGMACHTKFI